MAARAQLEQMRALPPGMIPPDQQEASQRPGSGPYL